MKKKILVIDDEKITLEFFDLMLTKLNYDVILAENGLIGLEKTRLHKPDIILLDNLMPELNGFEFTQIIKKEKEYEEFKDIPIIMFSALDDPEDKILGLEMGIADYITKPFNFSEVVARIRNVLKQKELTAQLIKRERKLAIIEALNANLITFLKHVKEPMKEIIFDIDKLKNNSEYINIFIEKYKNIYSEVNAMITSLEQEIIEIEHKKTKMKEEELSVEDLERKINKNLSALKKEIKT